MRSLLLLALLLPGACAWAQCGPYVHHPIWPQVEGYAYVNLSECGAQYTGVLWDNGATTELAQGLAVGMHTVALYVGNTPVETLQFEVEQLAWDLGQQVYTSAGALTVSVYVQLPYCGTQIFNNHACDPIPEQTWVYLLQDGIAVDSVAPVACPLFYHAWTDLDFGYTYQTLLLEQGGCGSTALGQLVPTYSCEGAALDLVAEAGGGLDQGSIAVAGVLPSPQAPVPPPLPLTGTFLLFAMPDFEQVDSEQLGSSAAWTGLPWGDYLVFFVADSLCAPVQLEVTIDATTGVAVHRSDAPALWPVPANDVLYWNARRPASVQVTDLQGRVVLQGTNTTQLEVRALVPGTYLLHFADGGRRAFVKE